MTDISPLVQGSVGIDVSKDSLDIFIDSPAEAYRVANQTSEITALVGKLKLLAPDYIIVEASGGFETALVTNTGDKRLTCVSRLPTANPLFRPSHWTFSQDGPLGCPSVGALWQRVPPTIVALNRCGNSRTRSPAATPPTVD